MGTKPTRRHVLMVGLTGAAVVATGLAGCSAEERRQVVSPTSAGSTPGSESRILLVFFSRAGENYYNGGRRNLEVGNTEVLAGMITDRVDCDVYEIEAADPYPDAYAATVDRNSREQDEDARPEIANPLPDLAGYDTVMIGSPIWNVRAPMIMSTFIEGVDLGGKVVLPFVTFAVSGMSGVDDDYRDALPDADVKTGLAVQGETVAEAGADLDEWLRSSGLLP